MACLTPPLNIGPYQTCCVDALCVPVNNSLFPRCTRKAARVLVELRIESTLSSIFKNKQLQQTVTAPSPLFPLPSSLLSKTVGRSSFRLVKALLEGILNTFGPSFFFPLPLSPNRPTREDTERVLGVDPRVAPIERYLFSSTMASSEGKHCTPSLCSEPSRVYFCGLACTAAVVLFSRSWHIVRESWAVSFNPATPVRKPEPFLELMLDQRIDQISSIYYWLGCFPVYLADAAIYCASCSVVSRVVYFPPYLSVRMPRDCIYGSLVFPCSPL